jgi:N-acetyl-anhydromuramyl-L-alanine amidase AmpD
MRSIHTIVVHCTATPKGRRVSVADVDRWHRQRGWSGIGYHALVGIDGAIWQGRDESRVGAHVKGYNTGSLGVAYVGGGNAAPYTDTRTEAQKESLFEVIDDWMARYPIGRIVGHRDLDPGKACPCFDATAEYADLLNRDTPVPLPAKDEMLERGSVGEDVREWQRRLVEYGYGWVAVDGDYGPETERVTRAFQVARGIVADGIAGPQTRETMDDTLVALELNDA